MSDAGPPAGARRATDAEALLRASRRPLCLGIGGGGDVVGALATAEACRLYHDARPVLGGVSWERRPIDPQPGPRAADEIEAARSLGPAVLAAGSDTRVRSSGVRFAEARMAELLGEETVLVDATRGPATIAAGLREACAMLGCDLIVFVDVGGDALAHGHEPGLASPLCDALLLAAAGRLAAPRASGTAEAARAGTGEAPLTGAASEAEPARASDAAQAGAAVETAAPAGGAAPSVLGAIFGIGCDGELTSAEVLSRIAEVAAAGGLAGTRGLTEPVVQRLEAAVASVPTEASAQALRCFRGELGEVTIRGGRRSVQLSPVGASTIYLDVPAALRSAARLAAAVGDAADLAEANEILRERGIRTELDYEREAAGHRERRT